MVHLAFVALLACACNTAKHGIADGYYRVNDRPVQVQVLNDTIALFPADGDTSALPMLPPVVPTTARPEQVVLRQTSFDVDVLTTLLKYRPAEGPLQRQLETNLSGSLFLGRRTDRYSYSYPAGGPARTKRLESHQGISGGVLVGLGGAPINPWVTDYRVDQEYTGVVLGYGLACIGAVDRTSVGVALGWDHLLDANADIWLYEGRPWLGLMFGLNLN